MLMHRGPPRPRDSSALGIFSTRMPLSSRIWSVSYTHLDVYKRQESYNEFYMEKGKTLEQLPSFHGEGLFELRQTMSQSERTLARCVEFWMSAADGLEEVLASEHLFEIITA